MKDSNAAAATVGVHRWSRNGYPARLPARCQRQRALFCPCGAAPAVAGLCRLCYGRALHSQHRFGGHRERVIERDRGTCRICGAANQRTVHHRRPGNHHPDLLVTVCRACHARIHRLAALRRYLPPALLPFWAELHPPTPVQLQLDWETAHA